MIVRIITINVVEGREEEFERVTAENVAGSLKEPGVIRFDLLRDQNERGTYYLYEVYRDAAATEEHKKTAHYAKWREAAQPLMDGDRTSVSCDVVAPTDAEHWS
jgi:autoinducer 2-degrading protein